MNMIRTLIVSAFVVMTSMFASIATAEEIELTVWARADPFGPLRGGNIVSAAAQLNDIYEAAGSDDRIKIRVIEKQTAGWDVDALEVLKAFAVGKGPDIYLVRHDLLAEFVDAGYAENLDDFITDNPLYFDDIIPTIFDATTYKGSRWGIAQGSEIRQFFYNKDMLREIGKSEDFIETLDEKVLSGEFTLQQFTDLVAEVVEAGVAKKGIIHRPNQGPEFVLYFLSHGVEFQDMETGELLFPRKEILETFKWLKRAVDSKAIPANNTMMSWDDVITSFKQERAFAYHHGIFTMPWQLGDAKGNTWPRDEKGYFDKIGWLMMPPAKKGDAATTLTTPVSYVVSAQSSHTDLAAHLVGLATLPYYNTKHVVSTFHTPILAGQASMLKMKDQWALRAAAPYLEITKFQPIHPKWSSYLGLIYKAIQGVETGRLLPEDAVDFIASEAQVEIGSDFVILESADER